MPIHVLFVCTGNICRSPMAEAVFNHLVAEAGLTAQFTVDSAGTDSYHVGDSPDSRTMRVLREKGIGNYRHTARRVTRADLQHYDYVLAMDEDHEYALNSMAHNLTITAKIGRLLEYAPHLGERDVPDPYYNGAFGKVYDLVLAGCRGLLADIRQQHGL